MYSKVIILNEYRHYVLHAKAIVASIRTPFSILSSQPGRTLQIINSTTIIPDQSDEKASHRWVAIYLVSPRHRSEYLIESGNQTPHL